MKRYKKLAKQFKCHACENITEDACNDCYNGNRFKLKRVLADNAKR